MLTGTLFLCIVAKVFDGDTFACEDGTHVRLWAANSQEKGEPDWRGARDFLRGLLPNGQRLTCEVHGVSLGRVVARCWVSWSDVAQAMVRGGHATACPSFDPIYVPDEQDGAVEAAMCRPDEEPPPVPEPKP